MKKIYYALIGFLLTTTLAVGGTSRPNILLITSEDNGPELGCYGEPYVKTPHLDALAEKGVRFNRAFVAQPGCSQSRSAIFTGLYPHQNGQIGLATWGFLMYEEDTPNMPRSLKEAGYRTGIIGKLHVNPASAFPFDFWPFKSANFAREDLPAYNKNAEEFINASGQPFFLMVNYPDAHRPFTPQVDNLPEDLLSGDDVKPLGYMGVDHPVLRQETADYYNCMSRLDTLVGNLLTTLEKSGKADNTLVIYLGDHGADLLRGKRTCYEGGVRIPLIISWPGNMKSGQVREELVSLIDLLPTVLDVSGGKPVDGLPGDSLVPLLKGETPDWRDHLFTEYHLHSVHNFYPQRTVRNDRYKLIHNLMPDADNPGYTWTMDNFYPELGDSLITGNDPVSNAYKLMKNPTEFELYDLDKDPFEFNNLSNDPGRQRLLTKLKKQLVAWREETSDPLLKETNLNKLKAEIDATFANGEPRKKATRKWKYPDYFFKTESVAGSNQKPAVKWTVQDSSDFVYRFLDNVKTTKLLHATPETGTFNLHGYLKYYKGILFACWDNQARDENTSGQHGMLRYSSDNGETWSDPKSLFPSLADNVPASETDGPKPFQTSQGFVVVDDRLYAVTCVDQALKKKVYRYNEVSRDRIGFLAREVRVGGSLGEVFWLSDEPPEPEPGYPTIPAGNPSLVNKINSYFKEPANLQQLLFMPRQHPDSDDEHRMTEPTQTWRLDDGTWVRLYRNQGTVHGTSRAEIEASRPRTHYAAFSFDNGISWTAPTRTNFPDTGSRANAGRLPNGQFYVINNPLQMSARQGGRAMLAISLSRDGLNFDRMAVIKFIAPQQRYEGKAKGANGYMYPHSVVVGKHLWVIYSVNKEDIEVARIPLSELYSL